MQRGSIGSTIISSNPNIDITGVIFVFGILFEIGKQGSMNKIGLVKMWEELPTSTNTSQYLSSAKESVSRISNSLTSLPRCMFSFTSSSYGNAFWGYLYK